MPRNDTYMRYDAVMHRYVLEEAYVLEHLNIDLRDVLNTSESADIANEADRLLKRVSDIVYSFVYRVVSRRNETERALALDERARPYILRAMEEQLLYMLNNGDLSAYAGINLANGVTIEKSRMRAGEIAPLAEDTLYESGFVSAVIQRNKTDIVPKYVEEGY